MSIRDIQRMARGDLHLEMSIPAFYFPAGDVEEEPVSCTVRDHTKFAPVGALDGGDYAQRQDTTPKLILNADEIPAPARNAVVLVEVGEAYRLSVVHPRDCDDFPCDVTRLSAAAAAEFEAPE